MKKFFAMLLCVLMLATTAAFATEYPDNVALDGTLPIVTEGEFDYTFEIINTTPESRVIDANEIDQAVKMEEATGIDLNWTGIPEAGFSEKINLMLASGDLPDMIWKGVDASVISQYLDQDLFVPTEDLIAEYAPNVQAILDSHPEYKALATYPDGHMYGFPYIEEMYGLTLTGGPFVINKVWLEKVGKEVPTTIDELKDVLIAFRDAGDLNGNGIDDEIPYACNFVIDSDGFDTSNTLFSLMGCFGDAVSYGSNYPYCKIEDGKVVFGVLDDAFLETINYFRGLQEEGLLYMDGFSGDGNYDYQLREDVATIGVFSVWSLEASIPNVEVREQYVALPRLTGPDGGMGVRCNRSELWGTSQSIITTECEYPEVLTALMNYLNEPEMAITTNWGTEGWSYIRREDGVLSFDLDENGVFNVPEGFESWNDMRQNSTPVQGGVAVLNEYYDVYAEYTYDAVQLLAFQRDNGKDEVLEEYADKYVPPVLMTPEEQAAYSQVLPQIKNIVRSYMVSSILDGGAEENWETFKSDLENAGLATMLENIQSAYDRYLNVYNETVANAAA